MPHLPNEVFHTYVHILGEPYQLSYISLIHQGIQAIIKFILDILTSV
jgi:hypothetical protein